MTDITDLLAPKRTTVATPQRMPVRAVVTGPPATLDAPTVRVVVPGHSSDYATDCRWIRQGEALPTEGADCLVVYDETGAGTVVWWSATIIDMATQAELDARCPSATTTYAPAWTSSGTAPVIGNGSLTGRYQRIGGLIFVTIDLLAGSTTTFGTGFYNLSLPAPAANVRCVLGGALLDTGIQLYAVTARAFGSSTFEDIVAGSNSVGPTNWGATNPYTFGNGDRMTISGVYVV